MDERKSEPIKLAPPSLQAATRRARVESAEQSEAVDDLRQAEIARLQLVEEAIRPVLDQAPQEVQLFDVGIAYGDRPRLFLDMISFVDLGHDRRTYRFFQDTRHGRVLIAESAEISRIVAAITNYVARRLVEREQALASDWRSRSAPAIDLKASARARQLTEEAKAAAAARVQLHLPEIEAKRQRRGFWSILASIFAFLLMTIGAFVLAGAVSLGAWAAWNAWGRPLWTAKIGPPPF
jgi:hypothetical protein